MKGYSTFLRVEPHHQTQFSIILMTPLFLAGGDGLNSLLGMQSAYSKPHRQSLMKNRKEEERKNSSDRNGNVEREEESARWL